MEFKNKMIVIREAKWFSNLTTAIIIVYASLLGLKTVGDMKNTYFLFFRALDYFVTIYFLLEILVKISSEKHIKDFFYDRWNLFDFLIVVVTLLPLENSSSAAVARLFRVFRVLRLLTARPELKRIIDMLIGAIPSIFDIVLLMFLVFYIYAILGHMFFAAAPSGVWNDFLIAMLTLFQVLTFENWSEIMHEAMTIHSWAWIYFVSFIIVMGFVFINLFVSVIIGEMEKLIHEGEHEEGMEKLDMILKEIDVLKEEIRNVKK